MPNFEVIYRTRGQDVVRDAFEASSEADVRSRIEAEDGIVVAILETPTEGLRAVLRNLAYGKLNLRFGVSTSELALLCDVLKALYSTGVPLPQALQLTIDETPNPWLRRRLERVLRRLQQGDDIYDAMSAVECRKAFPVLMRETIRTGEANGRLDLSLDRLATIFHRASETKRATITALLYPGFTLLVFFIVATVIAIVIPNELEKAAGAETLKQIRPQLPIAIRILFFIREHPTILLVPPLAIVLTSVIWIVGGRFRRSRLVLTRIERRVPMVGPILYQFALVRFLDLLSANHETGIQVAESLELIQRSISDALIEQALGNMRDGILGTGLGLADTMKPETVFPGLVKQMVRAGEESGRLTDMLMPILQHYNDRANASLKRALDMLPVVTIVLLGGVIGPVIHGVYMTLMILQDLQIDSLAK